MFLTSNSGIIVSEIFRGIFCFGCVVDGIYCTLSSKFGFIDHGGGQKKIQYKKDVKSKILKAAKLTLRKLKTVFYY